MCGCVRVAYPSGISVGFDFFKLQSFLDIKHSRGSLTAFLVVWGHPTRTNVHISV